MQRSTASSTRCIRNKFLSPKSYESRTSLCGTLVLISSKFEECLCANRTDLVPWCPSTPTTVTFLTPSRLMGMKFLDYCLMIRTDHLNQCRNSLAAHCSDDAVVVQLHVRIRCALQLHNGFCTYCARIICTNPIGQYKHCTEVPLPSPFMRSWHISLPYCYQRLHSIYTVGESLSIILHLPSDRCIVPLAATERMTD